MIFSLAALHASLGHKEEALQYLQQAISSGGGTNAATSARIDPRFQPMHDDPRFQALVALPATNAAAPVNAPPVNPKPPVAVPAKKN
jgi:hypothetical protein